MKFVTLIALIALASPAIAQDLTAAAALETDAVEASTPDLNSQRTQSAAALVAGCVATETYDTTLDAKDVVEFIAEECQAELAVADPVAEIDETEAAAEPTEDYPAKN